MFFKLLYLPSSINMMPFSSACDSARRESAAERVTLKSALRRLFLSLKKQLINNRQRAIKSHIDTLLP
ncbi:hypothetical protein [Pantoea sp. C2G6]|uniref:hypothetical protein n=1 Tax=Pantoea sp. C2G6 TaxID=3243084 RepID=UPI003EDA371C